MAANAGRLLPLVAQIATIGDELATLGGIDEKLKQFAAAPGDDSEAINLAHSLKSLRDREGRAVGGARQILADLGKEVNSRAGRILLQSSPSFAGEVGRGQSAEILRQAQKSLVECAAEVDRLLAAVGEWLTGAAKAVDAASVQL